MGTRIWECVIEDLRGCIYQSVRPGYEPSQNHSILPAHIYMTQMKMPCFFGGVLIEGIK